MTGRLQDVDGGYAWVVLGSLFVTDMLLGLLWTSVGMLTTAIVEEVEDDITQASLVAATTLGSSTLLGPVSGLLHDRLGHRWTGVVSGVLMLVGLTSASFCTSITGLICTFGLITGLGASLGMNLSGVAPGSYFVKKLSIAYGISQVGGGCGLFLVGPLVLFLLDNYQLSGTLLILGAIMFNVSLAGALIRPNTVIKDEEKSVELEAKSSDVCPENVVETEVGSSEALAEQSSKPVNEVRALLNDVDETPINVRDSNPPSADTVTNGKVLTYVPYENDTNHSTETHASIDNLYEKQDKDCHMESKSLAARNGDSPEANCSEKAQEPLIELTNIKDTTAAKKSMIILKLLQKAWKVLKNSGFYIYLLSSVFWTLGESSCMVHLPNFAEVKGSSPVQVATLLLVMGVTATLGGLLAGFAASDPNMGNMLLNFGFLGMSGVVTILFPLYSYSYSLQVVYSALYGVYSQAPWVMVGPICVQLVGVANMGFGYGLAAFSTGIGYLFGPPVASLLYESTGVYDYSFIFAGSCLVVAAFLIALVPVFQRHGKEESEHKTQNGEMNTV